MTNQLLRFTFPKKAKQGTHLSDQSTFTFYVFEKGKTRHTFKWPTNFYVLRPRIGAAGCVCKVTNWSHFLERGPRPRCLHKRTVNFRISSNCHQGFLFYSPKILPLSDFLHISRMICRCQRYNWQNIGYNFSSQDDINAYLIFVNFGAPLHYLGL